MYHAVVMAGGAGARFWPQSRVRRPKQFLPLGPKGRTLLQGTVERLLEFTPPERVLVVTGARHADLAREQVPQLPADNVLVEPAGRDTAACVGLATTVIAHRDAEAIIGVFPADHYIEPVDPFVHALSVAARAAEQRPCIVTVGIRPSHPATGYGYIHAEERIAEDGDASLYRAAGFEEKPDQEAALRYVESGEYFWNAGVFVFAARTMLAAFQEHAPDIAAHLARIGEALETSERDDVLEREFLACRRISLDYAIMEHVEDIEMVVAPFRWDDVGAWDALARFHDADATGNVVQGEAVLEDSAGCTVVAGDGLVALAGVTDLIVVRTSDVTLVAHKDAAQDIKKLVDQIRNEPRLEHYQ